MSAKIISASLRLAPRLLRPAQPLQTAFRPVFHARTFTSTGSLNELIKKFTQDHEWVQLDTSTETATIGITTYAAKSLGDVVFVELPNVGDSVSAGEAFGAVESVKSASDILSPVTGEVVDANSALEDKPSLINKSPEGDAWIAKVKVAEKSELEELMGETEYTVFCEKDEEH